jgi:hypothetical protein
MLLEVGENDEVVALPCDFEVEGRDHLREDLDVLLALEAELFAGLLDLMAMVEVLHALLQADCDDEAHDDGGDVDEEVSPGVGSVCGWMDVKHRVEKPLLVG